jgi:hypothetical protein
MATPHELYNYIDTKVALAPVVVSDNTAQTLKIVDLTGYKYAELVVITGTLADADATFAVALTAGDAVDSVTVPTTITDSAAADAATLVGAPVAAPVANFTFADDVVTKRLGYRPSKGAGKRWLSGTITPSANTGNAPLAAVWLLIPDQQPNTSPY